MIGQALYTVNKYAKAYGTKGNNISLAVNHEKQFKLYQIKNRIATSLGSIVDYHKINDNYYVVVDVEGYLFHVDVIDYFLNSENEYNRETMNCVDIWGYWEIEYRDRSSDDITNKLNNELNDFIQFCENKAVDFDMQNKRNYENKDITLYKSVRILVKMMEK